MKTHENTRKNTRKAIMSANDSKNWKYEEKWENTGKEATAKRWRYRKEMGIQAVSRKMQDISKPKVGEG